MTRKPLSRPLSFSNFHYCPLVRHFSSPNSLQKIEKIQEGPLRFLYNDQLSSYGDLLRKSGRCTMHVSRLRFLCIEIFMTISKLYPSYMQEIFKVKSSNYLLREITNSEHYGPNQVNFDSNSLLLLGPQIWNGLPDDIKSAENLTSLKDTLKKWEGPNCKCRLCIYANSN